MDTGEDPCTRISVRAVDAPAVPHQHAPRDKCDQQVYYAQ